jgi:hypothetical protein
LLAFQVSELQYPAYTSDYKHGHRGSISQNAHTRQRSKSSGFWLYARSDALYKKTSIATLFVKYTHLPCCDDTNPFCELCLWREARFISANRFFTTVRFNEPVQRTDSVRFISVKHSNKVNGVKASFVHLTWWCLWSRFHSLILHVGYESRSVRYWVART